MFRELFQKIYTRINWRNRSEAMTTALGATLLNRMDSALDETDNRIVALDALKAEESEVLQMIKEWSIDEKTGIITVTKKNGEKRTFDLNIEKIPVSFALSQKGILTMTTDDGTKFQADIASMIPILAFKSSDTVNVTAEGSGINKTYSFTIKKGSIKDEYLQPAYLADIKVQAQAADKSAGAAQTEADRAKKEADRSKTEADKAAAAAESVGVLGAVIGVKGNAETTYRQGKINLTPANIGALPDATVPVNKGGTGQTTAVNAANALINALSTGSDAPKDNDYFISQYVNGGTKTTTYHRRPLSALWTYIKNKINAATDIKVAAAIQDGLGDVIADKYLEKMYFKPHATFHMDGLESEQNIMVETGIKGTYSDIWNNREKIDWNDRYLCNFFLIIAFGRSSGSAAVGNTDFFKVSMVQPFAYGSSSEYFALYKETTLGSAGSTARYTLVAEKDILKRFSIKVPKESETWGTIYKLSAQIKI